MIKSVNTQIFTFYYSSAQRCNIASLSSKSLSITIIVEEGASDTEVPSDWVVTEGEAEIC